MSFKNIEFNSVSPKAITINGKVSQNIEINSTANSDLSKKIMIGDKVPKDAVKF